MIKHLFLLGLEIFFADTLDQGLYCPNHVTEETDSKKLNHHLKEIFAWVFPVDVSIANRGEGGDDPVESCYIDVYKLCAD